MYDKQVPVPARDNRPIARPGRAFDEMPRSLRTTIVEDRATRPEEVGWGGRIRTFTVLINSEVSYQLDHAPAEL